MKVEHWTLLMRTQRDGLLLNLGKHLPEVHRCALSPVSRHFRCLLFLEQDLVGCTRLLLQGLLFLAEFIKSPADLETKAKPRLTWTLASFGACKVCKSCLNLTLILQIGGLQILFELLVPLDQMPLGVSLKMTNGKGALEHL